MMARDVLKTFTGRRQLPIVLCAEAAECGLACLVMLARYHGHQVDLNSLRQRFSVSMAGSTLRSVMDLAGHVQLAPRAMRVELDTLPQVTLPAMIHWNMDHFVVLRSIDRRHAVIHDPARGIRKLTLAEFSNHFTGIVLELQPTADFQKLTDMSPVPLTALWSSSSGFGSALGQVFLLSLLLQATVFILPFMSQIVIDDVIVRSDFVLLEVVCWGFGLLLIVQSIVTALRSWAIMVTSNLFSYQVIGNIVVHLLRLPASFFEKRHVGDILSRIGSSSAIQDAIAKGIVASILDGGVALAAGTILFVYSPELGLIVMATLGLSIAVAYAYYPVSRRRKMELLHASAEEQNYLIETVRAATTIKLMGSSAIRESAWRNLYANVVNIGFRYGKYDIMIGLGQSLLLGVQGVLVVYVGAKLVIAGSGFSVGMLVAFMSFRQTFSDRVISLFNQILQFRMLGLHLERLGDIVTAQPESPSGPLPLGRVEGAIRLTDVEFRYGTGDFPVLDGITLDIEPGEFVAITGPSGGGKSTLLKAMLGLVTPQAGRIELDGITASPGLWQGWRTKVGVVAQNDQLVSGSIAENISFFDPQMRMEAVEQAARDAQIHDEIMRMPMQYQSLIGDMGSSLSGGQRQRVLFARALYRRPSVLFLDEGTANLDPATESTIAGLVTRLPITRIVVAHRPALIDCADRVLTVNAGKLSVLRYKEKVLEGVL